MPRESTSALLNQIANHKADELTVGAFVDELDDAGFAIVLFLFALPMALPLPATGLGTVLSLPILLIALQLVVGRRSLWFPERVRRKHLSLKLIRKAIGMVLPWLKRVEHLIHPRLKWLTSKVGHMMVGVVCMICGVAVALPFPLTNTLPSMGICIMALGLLERDGIVTLLGMVFGVSGCLVAAFAYYMGLDAFMDLIRSIV